jgi:transposase InsO family protein
VFWGRQDVDERRKQFVVRAASRKEEMRSLCREFEISLPTGYKWLNRYKATGRLDAVVEQSRRPHKSPNKTAPEIEQKVIELRKARPDWGAPKLQVLLKADKIELPVVTIHRILLRNALVRERDRHQQATLRYEREKPNELWQMDFKGMPPELSSEVLPLSVLDDHSRYIVGLRAMPGTKGEPVRSYLEQTFIENGVPEAMLVDHGTPWWNANHPWGLTTLAVWLMKQGIRLHFSGIRHPQTQGKVESLHRTIERAWRVRGGPADASGWPQWLHTIREEYTNVRPHQALDRATPASRWHPSAKKFSAHPDAWDYPSGAPVRSVNPSGQLQLANRHYTITRVLAKERVMLQPFAEEKIAVIYRNTIVREIDLRTGQSFPVSFNPYRELFSEA